MYFQQIIKNNRGVQTRSVRKTNKLIGLGKSYKDHITVKDIERPAQNKGQVDRAYIKKLRAENKELRRAVERYKIRDISHKLEDIQALQIDEQRDQIPYTMRRNPYMR